MQTGENFMLDVIAKKKKKKKEKSKRNEPTGISEFLPCHCVMLTDRVKCMCCELSH